MEPVTTDLILSHAITGAAGSLITLLVSKAPEWLIGLTIAQSSAVQQKMRANLIRFVDRLAERVSQLEAELPSEKGAVFQESMTDPSTALLVRRAVLAGAVTDNNDRHAILAELIAQRLTANAEDMIALAGGAACDVVSSLSSRHIRILGVMATLHKIRPSRPGKATSQVRYEQAVAGWWHTQLAVLCTDDLAQTTILDLEHLDGTGCIRVNFARYNLIKTFSLSSQPEFQLTALDALKLFTWWPTLEKIFERGVINSSLTSIGSLIGTLFHDEMLKSHTTINWD